MNIYSRKTTKPKQNRGFTLIEFMIALAMSAVVALAAVALYFYTGRLNQLAELNLKVQRELKQISRRISRDASFAGSFGCLTLTSLFEPDAETIDNRFNRQLHVFFAGELQNPYNPLIFDRPGAAAQSGNQNFGVTTLPGLRLNTPNFEAKGDALIFYYGRGDAGLAGIKYGAKGDEIDSIDFIDTAGGDLTATTLAGGYLALASCRALNIFPSGFGKINLSFTAAEIGDVRIAYEDIPNKHNITEINLLRYIVHAYVVGVFNRQPGLYLIQLGDNGTWEQPLLLSPYVDDLKTQFVFASQEDDKGNPLGCPAAVNDDIVENTTSAPTLSVLNQKFNAYNFYFKNNATFTPVTISPVNPKVSQGVDLFIPLAEERRYLPPAAVDISLTVHYPNLSAPFGVGFNRERGTSEESIKSDVKQDDNKEFIKTYRIFSAIKGGNQCANRNLLD